MSHVVSMPPRPTLAQINQHFYSRLWKSARFVDPEQFNTWPLVSELSRSATRRLEVGPGLHPRLPTEGTHFLDLCDNALGQLAARGGLTARGDVTRLPYATNAFDLVCAFDIIEHVEDHNAALSELARVLSHGGTLLLAIPLHPERWTSFDAIVGHARRYSPDEILLALRDHGLALERSAPYGMQSNCSMLLRFTASGFLHMPRFTIFLYNHFVMPLGLALQKPLRFREGMLDTARVDEVLLVCRRTAHAHRP